jgi:hypothetical protein
MPKTQRFMIACLALLLGIGIGIFLQRLIAPTPPSLEVAPAEAIKGVDTSIVAGVIKETLTSRLNAETGINPFLLLEQFPSLEPVDFDGAEAIQGVYILQNSELLYTEATDSTMALADLTDEGLATAISQYAARNDLSTADAVIASLHNNTTTTDPLDTSTSTDSFVACTMDAKVCPDGSYVGRVGPACEFAACPGEVSGTSTACTAEQKEATACIELYAPVCAAVQIQCITTPCEPIPKTFSNSCFACAEDSVTEYTTGTCEGDVPVM